MTSAIARWYLANIRDQIPATLREQLDMLMDRVGQDVPPDPPQDPPQPSPPPDPPPQPAHMVAYLAGVHVGATDEIKAACVAVAAWISTGSG